jgi:hypothetical protein
MYYTIAVITINSKLTFSCLGSSPGLHTQLFLLLRKTLTYARTPPTCYVCVQYIFTAPGYVWVCNGVEILQVSVSSYYVVSVSWFVG